MYRSPSYRILSKFINSLDKILESVQARNIILTGDINININGRWVSLFKGIFEYVVISTLARKVPTYPAKYLFIDHFMVRSSNTWQTFVFDELIDHSFSVLKIVNVNAF